MTTADSVLRQLRQSGQIALIAHVRPDGDTIGSCLALADVLKTAGKSVDLFCQDQVPPSLHFLQGTEQFQDKIKNGVLYDLTIAVDCSDEDRMGTCSTVYKAGVHTISIDHHISNTLFAETNLVDINAAATGEIIYQISRDFTKKLSKYAAEALYTAISTDTGSFHFRNTTAESYRIAAELVDCGIDVERITTLLYKTNRVERMRLLGKALNSLSLYDDNTIAIITITQDDLTTTGAVESEIENMVNYAKEIVGVEIGILLKESADGTVRISFRSKGEIDVSKLAGLFGGGGHKAAAGASLQMGIMRAKNTVLASSQKVLDEWRERKNEWNTECS